MLRGFLFRLWSWVSAGSSSLSFFTVKILSRLGRLDAKILFSNISAFKISPCRTSTNFSIDFRPLALRLEISGNAEIGRTVTNLGKLECTWDTNEHLSKLRIAKHIRIIFELSITNWFHIVCKAPSNVSEVFLIPYNHEKSMTTILPYLVLEYCVTSCVLLCCAVTKIGALWSFCGRGVPRSFKFVMIAWVRIPPSELLNSSKLMAEILKSMNYLNSPLVRELREKKHAAYSLRIQNLINISSHKPTAKSAFHPSYVGKLVLRGNSEDTSGITAGLHRLSSCSNTEPALANNHKKVTTIRHWNQGS